MSTRRLHALCCAAMVGLLAACAPPAGLSDKDVVGVWVAEEPDGGRVEFFPDGRFSMTGVPIDVLDPRKWDDTGGQIPTGAPIDATGTWQNLPQGDDYRRDPRLELTYDPGSGPFVGEIADYVLSIDTFADSNRLLLGIPLGDPDRHSFYVFVHAPG